MSALITHIVLAEKVFEKYFTDMDKREFVVGTCFPDIRYLGVVEREKTHFEGYKFTDLKNEDSFTAGLKLHSIVDNDMNRRFMKESTLLSFFPSDFDHAHSAVKILEDVVLYEKVKNWGEIISYFDMVLDKEIQFGISPEAISKWHRRLIKYFGQKPDRVEDIVDIYDRPEDAIEVMEAIGMIKDKGKAVRIIEDYYENFEKIIIN